jgi:predicted nucleic acid-binding protein
MSGEFCDTNVLVYAYDLSAGAKRQQAMHLVSRLWDARAGILSVQVLQELFVSLTRKVPQRLPAFEARQIVSDLASWRVFAPDAEDVLEAIDGSTRWQISFWDAMVVTAARRAGADAIWSEDLNDRQRYDGVEVRNPFREIAL